MPINGVKPFARRGLLSFLPVMLTGTPALTAPSDPFIAAWREMERLQAVMQAAESVDEDEDSYWAARGPYCAAREVALSTAATTSSGIQLKLWVIKERIDGGEFLAHDEYRLLGGAMDDLKRL